MFVCPTCRHVLNISVDNISNAMRSPGFGRQAADMNGNQGTLHGYYTVADLLLQAAAALGGVSTPDTNL